MNKVVNKQSLLFSAGYITTVLEDATVYSKHAGKKELDADDVQLAIQSRLDHSYTNPPPREVSCYEIHLLVSAGFAPWRVHPHRVRPHINSSSNQVLQIYRSHTEKKDNIVSTMKQNMFISCSLSL